MNRIVSYLLNLISPKKVNSDLESFVIAGYFDTDEISKYDSDRYLLVDEIVLLYCLELYCSSESAAYVKKGEDLTNFILDHTAETPESPYIRRYRMTGRDVKYFLEGASDLPKQSFLVDIK